MPKENCGTSRTTTVARAALSATLVVLAALKVPSLWRAAPVHVADLDTLLRTREAVVLAIAMEAGFGLMMLTSMWGRAVALVQLWLAALAGVVIAVVLTGGVVSSCGCLGSSSAGLSVRIAVLTGLSLTAYVARSELRAASRGPA